MLGLPYEQPAQLVEDYLEVFDAAFAGPGPVDVENDRFRMHNPLDITDIAPTPMLLAALGPVMLRIAGERADGTMLWMADERAIGEHVVPADHEGGRGRGPARATRRRRRPGRACARPTRSTARASGRTGCSGTPSTRRTTSACSSTATPRRRRHGRAGDARPTSSAGSGRSPTPARPTSRSASCRMGSGARRDPGLGRPDARVPGVARARPHVSAEYPATRGDLLWGSIPVMAADAAARFGDAHAVVDGDRRVTFTELIGEAQRVTGSADAVRRRARRPGRDLVPEPVRVARGRARHARRRARAVVPVNTRFKGEEVRYILAPQRRARRLHRRRVPRHRLRRHRRRTSVATCPTLTWSSASTNPRRPITRSTVRALGRRRRQPAAVDRASAGGAR